eukprot:5389268-Pyramimonas_sp.AAC.1
MRLSHASLAGNPAVVVADVASAAGSAISGICEPAASITVSGSGRAHGGGIAVGNGVQLVAEVLEL